MKRQSLSTAASSTNTAVDLPGTPTGCAGQLFFSFLITGATLPGYFSGSFTYLTILFTQPAASITFWTHFFTFLL
jgi:hypothetical protein